MLFRSVIDTVVDFDADMMSRQELIAGTILSEERTRNLKLLGTMQLKQDLIGGRAVTNGMDFQVILDKD